MGNLCLKITFGKIKKNNKNLFYKSPLFTAFSWEQIWERILKIKKHNKKQTLLAI